MFWSNACRVISQRLLRGGHLQLELEQQGSRVRAIAWRWQGEGTVPELVDVAFRLRSDSWQGEERLQLELVGLRGSGGGDVLLRRRQRSYWCRRQGDGVLIRNEEGRELQVELPALDQPAYLRALIDEAALALGLLA